MEEIIKKIKDVTYDDLNYLNRMLIEVRNGDIETVETMILNWIEVLEKAKKEIEK